MTWLENAIRRAAMPAAGRAFGLLLIALLLLAPTLSFAAGGENVALKFSSGDYIYLYISLGFGAVALLAGWFFIKKVIAQSPGSDKMQEVGKAITDGAMAYLKQQFRLMLVFVLILGVGLVFLYKGQYGLMTSIWVAISFLGGVAASYLAGYTGMNMAVKGNMRTAHAALTSYKRSLEVAFHSGAVAGLFTVGMGLIGATIIFLVAKDQAMTLLIGFGFGGSLAALFMRVGGGIYTKAADVGADLVGKVEAGIPEDDPRNPATIADNVGDNVGDCAGMAADIFESYEVTLVAAIILGAATASIFDAATWMKLVLFALMARGVGIVASIIGIFSMKGSDDLDADPLKAIRKGFATSALVSAALTAATAFIMMGGSGVKVSTSQLIPTEKFQRDEFRLIQEERNKLATEQKKEPYEITAADLQKDEALKKLELDKPENQQALQSALGVDIEGLGPVKELKGYSKIDFNDDKNPVLKYTGMKMKPEGQPDYVTLQEAFGEKDGNGWKQKPIQVLKLELTTQPPTPPVERGKPNPPQPPAQVRTIFFGPIDLETAKQQIDMVQKQGTMKIKELAHYDAYLYSNPEGEIMIGFDNPTGADNISRPHAVQGSGNMVYFKQDVQTIKKLNEARKTDFNKPFPQTNVMKPAVVEHKEVPWYLFAICIFFGIGMAFAIELLTDYYVSTHKRPVQEVANVATAGPAPMIIQGFAYAAESSVFSVFAIVAALILPMLVFPPAEYGGYVLSFYGIALVGLGLLTTTGYILAMDTFGPISDNAQGVFEMSGAGHTSVEGSKAVQRLDAAGNTTKALTKGFAIATAVVAAVALFHTYLESAKLGSTGLRLDIPEIFLGLLIGGAAPYLFSAFSINAVGRASFQLIAEVRRQFAADPGIMKGTSKPDYGKCVAIVTQAAQKELLGPGLLAISLPVMVGFGFAIGKPHTMIGGNEFNLVGAQALGGFLAGAILSGQLMAVLLANSGGMWDNAKKLIEDGLHGGKGTEAHKAGVVCDTVGDPFKDTAGPALNPLIKVMNLVALLLAPVLIQPYSTTVLICVTAGAILLLVIAIVQSKRGSMASGMADIAKEKAGAASLKSGGESVSAVASVEDTEKES